MKKLLEPPLPITFWPHAVLQMAVFVLYVLLLEPRDLFPSVQMRLGMLEEVVGWSLPFFIWLVYVFLLGEQTIRLTQRWAAQLFPFKHFWFLLCQLVVAVPLMYLAFVGLECVLFFVAMGRYPLQFGPLWFNQGFLYTLEADLPLVLVLGLGESLRHWLYGGWIRKWHHERGLRLLPTVEE